MRAVVTGASSGIGRAFAAALAARGHDLVISGRRADVLAAVCTELQRRYGIVVTTVVGDLADPSTLDQLAAHAGSPSEAPAGFLVNNAGFGLACDFADADPGRLADMVQVHAAVPLGLTRAVLPGMIAAGGGVIVNVGSLAGRVAVPGSSVYVATKSFLERFSESLALEVAERGIVVQALLPGYVRTDFHRDVPDYRAKQRNRGLIRWMTPDAVVAASLHAAERARRRLRPGHVPRYRDVVVIPGAANRLLAQLGRVTPVSIIYRAASGRPQLR